MRTAFLCCVFIAAQAEAQTGRAVLPPRAATATGNWWAEPATYLSSLPTRHQLGYESAALGVEAALLQEVAFRRANSLSNPTPALQVRARLDLSHGPRAPMAFTSSFAGNHGTDVTVVFDGTTSWPATTQSPTVPPFVVRLKLQRPFAFARARGPSLVIDLRVLSHDGGANDRWFFDAMRWPDAGATLNHATGCRGSLGERQGSISWLPQELVPGGSWVVRYSGAPPSTPALASIGAEGAGTRWLGLLLPIRLGATSCHWAASSFAYWPFVIDARGDGIPPPVRLPASIAEGTSFYDQAVALDPRANVFGLVTFTSWKWTIGSATPFPIVAVIVHNDTGQAQGALSTSMAPVVELTW
jgi:hypothetical protein